MFLDMILINFNRTEWGAGRESAGCPENVQQSRVVHSDCLLTETPTKSKLIQNPNLI